MNNVRSTHAEKRHPLEGGVQQGCMHRQNAQFSSTPIAGYMQHDGSTGNECAASMYVGEFAMQCMCRISNLCACDVNGWCNGYAECACSVQLTSKCLRIARKLHPICVFATSQPITHSKKMNAKNFTKNFPTSGRPPSPLIRRA